MSLFLRHIFAAILLLSCSAAFADTPAFAPAGADPIARIDRLMYEAMAEGLIAGGVVLIGEREGVLFERVYGRAAAEPDAGPMSAETIFDLASLTKVVATAPVILKLAEDRRLSLIDPICKWFPEFAGKGKDDLLVMNLLTHTSGLDDFYLPAGMTLQAAIQGAASQKNRGDIGTRFKYADINFILLSELVKRVTGSGLDDYSVRNFYRPMGMTDTVFNPGQEKALRCSSTAGEANCFFRGVPQDVNARRLGGVSGHAGLFSTARDLSRFCRMLLAGGKLEGKEVLSERAVMQMTAPYFSRGGQIVRGLGWDIASPYSSPRGKGFSEMSFGHTGYSGSSIWIDPAADTFVVLLTARLEYRKIKQFAQFRSDLSSLAAELSNSARSEGRPVHASLQN